VLLLSVITWVPGLILYGAQAGLSGWAWTKQNLWLAEAIVVGLITWITILSLIALALSAWVKWKLAAGSLVLAVFVAGAGFGGAINNVLRTHYGGMISLNQVVYTIWGELFRYDWGAQLSLGQCWSVLAFTCTICVWLLARRIRPFEVVK
jgi:ABC-2 type transport system permease protein